MHASSDVPVIGADATSDKDFSVAPQNIWLPQPGLGDQMLPVWLGTACLGLAFFRSACFTLWGEPERSGEGFTSKICY